MHVNLPEEKPWRGVISFDNRMKIETIQKTLNSFCSEFKFSEYNVECKWGEKRVALRKGWGGALYFEVDGNCIWRQEKDLLEVRSDDYSSLGFARAINISHVLIGNELGIKLLVGDYSWQIKNGREVLTEYYSEILAREEGLLEVLSNVEEAGLMRAIPLPAMVVGKDWYDRDVLLYEGSFMASENGATTYRYCWWVCSHEFEPIPSPYYVESRLYIIEKWAGDYVWGESLVPTIHEYLLKQKEEFDSLQEEFEGDVDGDYVEDVYDIFEDSFPAIYY